MSLSVLFVAAATARVRTWRRVGKTYVSELAGWGTARWSWWWGRDRGSLSPYLSLTIRRASRATLKIVFWRFMFVRRASRAAFDARLMFFSLVLTSRFFENSTPAIFWSPAMFLALLRWCMTSAAMSFSRLPLLLEQWIHCTRECWLGTCGK